MWIFARDTNQTYKENLAIIFLYFVYMKIYDITRRIEDMIIITKIF